MDELLAQFRQRMTEAARELEQVREHAVDHPASKDHPDYASSRREMIVEARTKLQTWTTAVHIAEHVLTGAPL